MPAQKTKRPRGRPRKHPKPIQPVNLSQSLPKEPAPQPEIQSQSGSPSGTVSFGDGVSRFDAVASSVPLRILPAGESDVPGAPSSAVTESPVAALDNVVANARRFVKAGVDLPYNFASGRWGEHWKLNDDEREAHVAVLTPLAEIYAKRIFEQLDHPEVAMAVAVVGAICLKKYNQTLQMQAAALGGLTVESSGKPEPAKVTSQPNISISGLAQ